MQFRNDKHEKQIKRSELWDYLGEYNHCDFGDIEAIDNDNYVDTTTNKKYKVELKRKQFIITEL